MLCDVARNEALEQLSAASEVLKVISSLPGELGPVFQSMLENATRLCEGNLSNFFLYEPGVQPILITRSDLVLLRHVDFARPRQCPLWVVSGHSRRFA